MQVAALELIRTYCEVELSISFLYFRFWATIKVMNSDFVRRSMSMKNFSSKLTRIIQLTRSQVIYSVDYKLPYNFNLLHHIPGYHFQCQTNTSWFIGNSSDTLLLFSTFSSGIVAHYHQNWA